MIPLKKLDMQGAKFSRNDVLIVYRMGWKIEATPQIGFFQRNQRTCLRFFVAKSYTCSHFGHLSLRLWARCLPFIFGDVGSGEGAPSYTDAFKHYGRIRPMAGQRL
jgi:hypothetical protein